MQERFDPTKYERYEELPEEEKPKFKKVSSRPEEGFEEGFVSQEAIPPLEGQLEGVWKERFERVEEQLERQRFQSLDTEDGRKHKVGYRILDAHDLNEPILPDEVGNETVVVISGFPGSHHQFEDIGTYLAVQGGKRVIVMSLPGFGESSNAPLKWLTDGRLFEHQTEIIGGLVNKIRGDEQMARKRLTTDRLTIVGGSMGATIAAKFAKQYPDSVSNLFLLNPASVEAESFFSLASRSPRSMGSDIAFLQRRKKTFPKTGEQIPEFQKIMDRYKKLTKDSAKNWRPDRIPQRLAEVGLLHKGGILNDIENVQANIGVIHSEEDRLFPSGKSIEEIPKHAKRAKKVETSLGPGTHASMTYWAEQFSTRILVMLDKWRKEEQAEQK